MRAAFLLEPGNRVVYHGIRCAVHSTAASQGVHHESPSNEAVRRDPTRANFHFGRGEAYLALADYDAAIESYTEGLRIDPKSAGAYYNRGLCRHKKRDWDGAMGDYTEALRSDPKLAPACANRGRLHMGARRYDAARVAQRGPMSLHESGNWLAYFNDPDNRPCPADREEFAFRPPWLYNHSVEWSAVLKIGNMWYDRFAEAAHKPTRSERIASAVKVGRALEDEASRVAKSITALDWSTTVYGVIPHTIEARHIAGLFLGLSAPDLESARIEEE